MRAEGNMPLHIRKASMSGTRRARKEELHAVTRCDDYKINDKYLYLPRNVKPTGAS